MLFSETLSFHYFKIFSELFIERVVFLLAVAVRVARARNAMQVPVSPCSPGSHCIKHDTELNDNTPNGCFTARTTRREKKKFLQSISKTLKSVVLSSNLSAC